MARLADYLPSLLGLELLNSSLLLGLELLNSSKDNAGIDGEASQRSFTERILGLLSSFEILGRSISAVVVSLALLCLR